MINSAHEQELLSMEILLKDFKIKYEIWDNIYFDTGKVKLIYRGPELHWKVFGESFKMNSMRKYNVMIKLKKYIDCYERFLLLRSIPDLLNDMIRFEILPTYLML